MPGSTLRNAIPYPLGSDPAANLDTIGQAMAEKIDALIGEASAVTVNLVASATGTSNVVFAAPFDSPPIITTSVEGSSFYVAAISARTINGFTVTVRHISGTAATASVLVHWHASQS